MYLHRLLEWLRSPRLMQFVFTSVSLVLLVFAAWTLAQLTWRLAVPDSPAPLTPLSAIAVPTVSQPVLDTRRIKSLHLFGEQGAIQQAAPVQDAPVTQLNIRLVGVTASTNPNLSAAIVQQGSTQTTYIPGDIIANSRAVVKQILSDRVLLENNNRLETLWLEGRDGGEAPLTLVTEPDTAAQESEEAVEPELTSQQMEILELISITPQQSEQGLIGYRLAPKGDSTLFRELGLRPGDLAVAMNGYDLTNMADAIALISQLEGATQAQIRVLRDGEYVDIDVYIPEE
ncbi:type II secretion system protein GspC [Aliidiomarina taiwanensis]|uniref:Type II secretion system protein GspC n=1 Tax=Aliidiomarina taiwanensis TaxID=946228 RepID=A0A432X7Z6_9GAMM|nr:type II secretion system protein GspC [Aliidiomarina taiwanensis]RUO42983.1 type II secretion system protein GspC [Aliidiomarina taiwanensis]